MPLGTCPALVSDALPPHSEGPQPCVCPSGFTFCDHDKGQVVAGEIGRATKICLLSGLDLVCSVGQQAGVCRVSEGSIVIAAVCALCLWLCCMGIIRWCCIRRRQQRLVLYQAVNASAPPPPLYSAPNAYPAWDSAYQSQQECKEPLLGKA
jgi:hypothetical protein